MRSVVFITNDSSLYLQLSDAVKDRWSVHHATTKADALTSLSSAAYDVILMDPVLRCCNGKHLMRYMAEHRRQRPLFIVARKLCVAFHQYACRLGVSGYHVLPGGIHRLISEVELFCSAVTHPATGCHGDCGCAAPVLPYLRGSAAASFLGASPEIMQVRAAVYKYRHSCDPVLITGESGSGKELVSRMIHDNSPVQEGPFVPFNASCFCNSIADSQFFGTVRGAFTDAGNSPGVFEKANDGTLFLDEVSELQWPLQAKLLRVLEDGQITRLGSARPLDVSVRIVCATNRDLAQMCEKGLFRADLFYRLDVLRIRTPPLRNRIEDIPALAESVLVGKKKQLAPAALQKLRAYHWPGNVRQFLHCLDRAAGEAPSAFIYPRHLEF